MAIPSVPWRVQRATREATQATRVPQIRVWECQRGHIYLLSTIDKALRKARGFLKVLITIWGTQRGWEKQQWYQRAYCGLLDVTGNRCNGKAFNQLKECPDGYSLYILECVTEASYLGPSHSVALLGIPGTSWCTASLLYSEEADGGGRGGGGWEYCMVIAD